MKHLIIFFILNIIKRSIQIKICKKNCKCLQVQTLVSTVVKYLDDDSEHCKFTALYTLHRLIKKFPDRMVQDGLVCESLLPVLSDPSEDCLTLALGLLCACFVSRPAEIRQVNFYFFYDLHQRISGYIGNFLDVFLQVL